MKWKDNKCCDQMDQLMDAVMEKLLALLFDPVPQNTPENENSIMDMLNGLMQSSSQNNRPSSSPFGIGFKASYQYKEVKKSGKSREEVIQSMEAAIPIGRFGKPSEIGAAAAFLASPAAAYITGTNLTVDGGRTVCL